MRTFDFETDVEVTISVAVRVTGWRDGGVRRGGPDRWEPPDGEEDREVVGASVAGVELPDEVVRALEPYLRKPVGREEIGMPER